MSAKSSYAAAHADAVAGGRATGNKVAERVTVNLSRKSAEALEAAASLTEDTKTDVINKALQLYYHVRKAQDAGGGAWLQDNEKAEPVKTLVY